MERHTIEQGVNCAILESVSHKLNPPSLRAEVSMQFWHPGILQGEARPELSVLWSDSQDIYYTTASLCQARRKASDALCPHFTDTLACPSGKKKIPHEPQQSSLW